MKRIFIPAILVLGTMLLHSQSQDGSPASEKRYDMRYAIGVIDDATKPTIDAVVGDER